MLDLTRSRMLETMPVVRKAARGRVALESQAAPHGRSRDVDGARTRHMRSDTEEEMVMRSLATLMLACLVLAVCSDEASAARWKVGAGGCSWDDTDNGPDQCDPNETSAPQGRYRVDDGTCWFDVNDRGPNQCNPNVALGEPPIASEDTPQQFDLDLFEGEGGYDTQALPVPSCRAYTKRGNGGYISVQVNPVDGPCNGAPTCRIGRTTSGGGGRWSM